MTALSFVSRFVSMVFEASARSSIAHHERVWSGLSREIGSIFIPFDERRFDDRHRHVSRLRPRPRFTKSARDLVIDQFTCALVAGPYYLAEFRHPPSVSVAELSW